MKRKENYIAPAITIIGLKIESLLETLSLPIHGGSAGGGGDAKGGYFDDEEEEEEYTPWSDRKPFQ